MPTAYLKKLATLNHISIDKLEKFWSQAKEIAKSEGQGKSWGLITTIFQNKLKKEGYKVKAFTSLADTDELDDADLGINVDPKEYHKQKAKQLSLINKLKNSLNSIKTNLNTESEEYIREMKQRAEELDSSNEALYEENTESDKWINYKLSERKNVRERQLFSAFVDGIKKNRIHHYKLTYEKVSDMFDETYKRVMSLVSKNKIILYRGVCIPYPKNQDLESALRYFKYNLMKRNSWTSDIKVAKRYAKESWFMSDYDENTPFLSMVLKIETSIEDVNLPVTFWLEGAWYKYKDREINLRKSFEIKNISIVSMEFIHNNKYNEDDKTIIKKKNTIIDDDDEIESAYKQNSITADTDEFDDADLGINVDPKEYHKQKSLQMSLQAKLNMVKKDINKETDNYNKELEDIAKRLNEENRKRYSRDNDGDKWLHYNGTVNKEVLLEAYKDGLACGYDGFGTITSDDDIREELNYYKNSVYPRFAKLLKGSSLRVYRGLDFHKLFCSDVDLLKNYFKYLKYNLMDRNSWTTSIEIAKRYIDYPWFSIILRMDCTLEDANLPLSAWLEGYWFDKNKEINLRKSLKVKNIKCVFVGDDLRELGFNEKEFNKIAAMYEPDRLDDDTQKYFDSLNHTKELTKENTPTLLAMLKHSYFKNVRDNIKQIWARSRNSEQTANEWLLKYHPLIVECEKFAIEPKVCARMCYIKYHKENPHTKHLNKNNDVSFNTLKKEALHYFEGLRKWKEENKEFNKEVEEFMKNQVTSSVETIIKVNKDGTKYLFEKLSSVKDVVENLKNIDVLHDYFDKDEDYFKDRYGVSKKEATLFDLPWDFENTIVFIKYNNGKEWYSVNEHSKLSDLKLTGIKDATFEWNADVVSFYGKDCKIEKFDKDDEDSAWVVNCSNTYLYQGKVITASSKYEVVSYRPQHKYLGFTPDSIKDYLKHFAPIEQVCVNDYNLYKREVARLLKNEYKELIINKIKFNGLLKLCFEAKVSTYDAYRWIDYIHVYNLI